MKAETSTGKAPPGEGAAAPTEEVQNESRRDLLKRAAAGVALLATGAVVGAVARGAVAATAKTAQAADIEEQRLHFLAEARATALGARPAAAPPVEMERDSALADLADPSRQRPAKLRGGLPQAAAVAERPLAAAAVFLDESILVRMQRDLERAIQKPLDQRRWVMAIDLRKCIGCSACTVACKAENKLPPGVVYRPVIEEELGEYPHVSRRFTPRPCMQCDNPPCVPVCPVGATYKRPDGIVEIDYTVCIGCRYCIAACPYGARTFDFGADYTEATPQVQAYERQASFEYGRAWPREGMSSPIGNVRKCQFCLHRQEEGMLPACVTTCVGAATYFGDANDPESLVSELISRPNVGRLKEELGTQPKVYYLA